MNSLEGHLFSTNRNEFFFSLLTSCTIENALVWYIRSLFSPSPVSYKIDLADISSEILTIKIFLIRVKIERRKKIAIYSDKFHEISLFSPLVPRLTDDEEGVYFKRKPRKLFSRFSIKLSPSSVKIIVDQTFNRDIFLRMFISRPPRRERSRTQAAEIPLSVQQRGRFLPRPVFL